MQANDNDHSNVASSCIFRIQEKIHLQIAVLELAQDGGCPLL